MGKAYAEVEGYPGLRVLEEQGIVNKWPHPEDNGQSIVTVVHGVHPGPQVESITTERYRIEGRHIALSWLLRYLVRFFRQSKLNPIGSRRSSSLRARSGILRSF